MIELVNVKPTKENKQFSVQIQSGSMVCITGDYRNNLLRIIGGLNIPYEGNVFVNNRNLIQMSEDKRTIFRKRIMSYLYNSDNLIDGLTVKDNILLASHLDKSNVCSDQLLKITDQLRISKDMLNIYPSSLSTLQKFIVALARGLVSQHQFILVEDLDLLQNIKHIEDYFGILKVINQTNNITIIVTLADSKEQFSLFDQEIIYDI